MATKFNLQKVRPALAALIVLAGIVLVLVVHKERQKRLEKAAAEADSAARSERPPLSRRPIPPGPTPLILRTPEDAARAARTFDDFTLRPFAVASQSPSNEWTKEDARDPAVIRRIAHNELEVQRMLAENSRIKRRQLVYRKEPTWMLVERAKGDGRPLSGLTLPALDGRELSIEVTGTDLEFSGLSGTLSGRVAGQPNSVVTVAFQKGREAFTVISPDDGTFLQGHPREPGEVIVTSFDPATYQPLPGGEPIKSPAQ